MVNPVVSCGTLEACNNCMGLFVRFQAHANPETKAEYLNLIKRVWVNNVKKMVLLVISTSFLFILAMPIHPHSHNTSIQLQETVGGS
ncbi:hypothetical protein [Paenibacillus farraposensis]|uniref:hypothetical protein n=1 Tax=Paenibacillus farraposensis TaxID=2807095 RepID=UPI003672A60C